jgi:hypothetical protein
MSNNKYRIYIPIFRAPQEPQRSILEPLAEIITGEPKSEAEWISHLQGADAVLVASRSRITGPVMEA